MRLYTIAVAILSFLGAGHMQAQQVTKLSVLSTMDIFRAGGYNDGSSGSIAPIDFQFRAQPNQTITLSRVTGQWTCQLGEDFYGPDGDTSGLCFKRGGPNAINPIGTFSGFQTTDFFGALVGMFLEDTLPVIFHPTLRFYMTDSSRGGIQTDFSFLNPKIGQVFFIGDGLTGTGFGTPQVFSVPPTATHLYLGSIDVCGFSESTPGCYQDNVGQLNVVLTLHKTQ